MADFCFETFPQSSVKTLKFAVKVMHSSFSKMQILKPKINGEIRLHDRGQLTSMLKLLHLLFTTDLYFSLNINRTSGPYSSLFCKIFCLPSFLLSWCLPPVVGKMMTLDLWPIPLGEGQGLQGQICDILRPQLAMTRFLPLWPRRFPHFGNIHQGEGAWGGSDIRSMSSIRPLCKCRCPPLPPPPSLNWPHTA